MAIKKNLRSINCTRKKAYSAKKDAQRAIDNAWRIKKWRLDNGARPIRAYKCEQCNQWHTTSKSIETMMKRNDNE